jgi:hypothetical protein
MIFGELKIGELFVFEKNLLVDKEYLLKLKTGHEVFKYIREPKSKNAKCVESALVLTRGMWDGK